MPVLTHSYAHFNTAPVSLAVVQADTAAPASGTSISFTLGSVPAAGNTLAAFCSYSQSGAARHMDVPSGWAKLRDASDGNCSLAVFLRMVQPADGTTWSFTVSGTSSDWCSGILYEISGADTARVADQSAQAAVTVATATPASAAVVPSAGSCLAVAAMAADTSRALSGVSAGWTGTSAGSGNYHTCYAAARDALTSDTATPLSCTFTLGGTTVGMTQAVLFLPPQGSARFCAGTAGSGTAVHFTDQYGSPFMVRGDTAWGLMQNAGITNDGTQTWQYDIDAYLAARAAQGFNCVLVSACDPGGGDNPNSGGSTWDGIAPFTSWDASGPALTGSYWARMDYVLTSAQAAGITVFFCPCSWYAFGLAGASLNGKTATQIQGYGAALGARYAGAANLVWQLSTDYHGSYDAQLTGFMTGLRGAGDTHLMSIENYPGYDSRWYAYGNSSAGWGNTAGVDYNWCYDYGQSYGVVEYAYAETSPVPVIHADGCYYLQQTPTEALRLYWRKWQWWALTSGSRGTFFGTSYGWNWGSNACGQNISQHQTDTGDLNTAWNRLAGYDGWHELVPDLSSQLVTAGRGTHLGPLPNGDPFYAGGNDYVTAARTADGSLAVIYIPAATTITIDESQAGGTGNYTATWVDPVTGAGSAATAGATYNTTAKGSNSAGDPDWVLVLRAAA